MKAMRFIHNIYQVMNFGHNSWGWKKVDPQGYHIPLNYRHDVRLNVSFQILWIYWIIGFGSIPAKRYEGFAQSKYSRKCRLELTLSLCPFSCELPAIEFHHSSKLWSGSGTRTAPLTHAATSVQTSRFSEDKDAPAVSCSWSHKTRTGFCRPQLLTAKGRTHVFLQHELPR